MSSIDYKLHIRGGNINKSKSIVSINDYGKINIKLKDLMDGKGITRNCLASASNTRFKVVNKWYDSEIEKNES